MFRKSPILSTQPLLARDDIDSEDTKSHEEYELFSITDEISYTKTSTLRGINVALEDHNYSHLTLDGIASQSSTPRMHRQTLKEENTKKDMDASATGNEVKGYVRHTVNPDGDCGYTAFGIERKEAAKRIIESLHNEEILNLIKPVLKQQLLRKEFAEYLINNGMAGSGLKTAYENYAAATGAVTAESVINLEKFSDDLAILASYINYDIRDSKVDHGWAHPAFLQALASICSIELHIWQLGENAVLRTHSQIEYAAYKPNESTGRTDLLFINNNHFERLDIIGGFTGDIYPIKNNEKNCNSYSTDISNDEDIITLSSLEEECVKAELNTQKAADETPYLYGNDFTLQLTIEAIKEGGIGSGVNPLSLAYNELAKWFLELTKPAEVRKLEAANKKKISSKKLEEMRAAARKRFLVLMQREIVDRIIEFGQCYSAHSADEKTLVSKLNEIPNKISSFYTDYKEETGDSSTSDKEEALLNYMLHCILQESANVKLNEMKQFLTKGKIYEYLPLSKQNTYAAEDELSVKKSFARSWEISLSELESLLSDVVSLRELNNSLLKKFESIINKNITQFRKVNHPASPVKSSDNKITDILVPCQKALVNYDNMTYKLREDFTDLLSPYEAISDNLKFLIKKMKDNLLKNISDKLIKELMKRVLMRLTEGRFPAEQIEKKIEGHFDDFLLQKRFSVAADSIEVTTGNSLPLFARQYDNNAIYELFDESFGVGNSATTWYNKYYEKASNYDPKKSVIVSSGSKDKILANFKELDSPAGQYRLCREGLRDLEKKILAEIRGINAKIEKNNKHYIARAGEANRYLNIIQTALCKNYMANVKRDLVAIFDDPKVDKGWWLTRFLFGRIIFWYKLHDMVDRSLQKIEKNISTYWMLQPGRQDKVLQEEREADRKLKKIARELQEYKHECTRLMKSRDIMQSQLNDFSLQREQDRKRIADLESQMNAVRSCLPQAIIEAAPPPANTFSLCPSIKAGSMMFKSDTKNGKLPEQDLAAKQTAESSNVQRK